MCFDKLFLTAPGREDPAKSLVLDQSWAWPPHSRRPSASFLVHSTSTTTFLVRSSFAPRPLLVRSSSSQRPFLVPFLLLSGPSEHPRRLCWPSPRVTDFTSGMLSHVLTGWSEGRSKHKGMLSHVLTGWPEGRSKHKAVFLVSSSRPLAGFCVQTL